MMFIFSYLFSDGVVPCCSKISYRRYASMVIKISVRFNEPKEGFDPRWLTPIPSLCLIRG